MSDIVLVTSVMMFVVRANLIRRFWRLPMRNGEDYFLAQRVVPNFYREAGAALLRRYRVSVVVPLFMDSPLSVWLAVTQRYDLLFVAQFISLLATMVVNNVMIAHFSYRAQALTSVEQEPTTTLQLSMAPRRLRDHTNRTVELVLVAAIVLSLGLLAGAYLHSRADGGDQIAHIFRSGMVVTIWILYMQVGLLLLKVVFVRWRMPLPAKRTDDFRQWRSAWLSYHLKLFDSIRLLSAVDLLSGVCIKLYWKGWTQNAVIVACAVWIPGLIAFTLYLMREQRRLAAAERELKPIEMVKEFPRRAIPQGRFLAGGLLYFNRDNPAVLVRSAQGIAINLAQPIAYVWPAYFMGLALLMTMTMAG